VRQYSVVVPPWAANVTDSTAAIQMYVTVRPTGIAEEAQVLLRVGPTQRGLLVSSTWDGLPASWGEIGAGPCNFRRDYPDFQVRYSDYRNLVVNLTLNGQPITLNPKVDTAHVADADNAVFNDQFYYDGQCEPQYRNVPFRDPVGAQPPPTDFSAVPIQNPPDTTPPNVVAIEPPAGASVPAGTNLFYFLVDDEGLSGPASATLYIDGTAVASSSANPFAFRVTPGAHTWQIKGFDVAGNSAFSRLVSFSATGSSGVTNPPAPRNIAGSFSNGQWWVQLNSPGNWLYILERSTNLQDWTPLSSRITGDDSMLLLQDSNPPVSGAFYRILVQPP
jgi:hypothetical protein